MTIAVADTQTTTFQNNVTQVVISKPSGLATGDLMIAHLSSLYSAGTKTWDDLAGWTIVAEESNTAGGNKNNVQVMYKIAASGDVAASNFTFTITGGTVERGGGALLRITGHNPSSTVEFNAHGQSVNADAPILTGDLTPTYANSMFIIFASSDEPNAISGISTYQMQTSNPTWTEIYDFTTSFGPSGIAAAYAVRASTSITGSYGWTTDGASGNLNDYVGFLLVIRPIVDATVSPAVISAVSTIPTPTTSTGVTVVATRAVAAATIPAPTQKTLQEYHNPDKASHQNWNNPDKSTL